MKLYTRGGDGPPGLVPWDTRLIFAQTQALPTSSALPISNNSPCGLHLLLLWFARPRCSGDNIHPSITALELQQIYELQCKKGLVSHQFLETANVKSGKLRRKQKTVLERYGLSGSRERTFRVTSKTFLYYTAWPENLSLRFPHGAILFQRCQY